MIALFDAAFDSSIYFILVIIKLFSPNRFTSYTGMFLFKLSLYAHCDIIFNFAFNVIFFT